MNFLVKLVIKQFFAIWPWHFFRVRLKGICIIELSFRTGSWSVFYVHFGTAVASGCAIFANTVVFTRNCPRLSLLINFSFVQTSSTFNRKCIFHILWHQLHGWLIPLAVKLILLINATYFTLIICIKRHFMQKSA